MLDMGSDNGENWLTAIKKTNENKGTIDCSSFPAETATHEIKLETGLTQPDDYESAFDGETKTLGEIYHCVWDEYNPQPQKARTTVEDWINSESMETLRLVKLAEPGSVQKKTTTFTFVPSVTNALVVFAEDDAPLEIAGIIAKNLQ